MPRFLALLFTFLAVTLAHAQSVRWEPSDSGDPSELTLIFSDCAPEGDPTLPKIDGVTLSLAGTSSQTTINNFNLSRSTILSYRARTSRSGSISVPAFTVKTNKGNLTVPAFTSGAVRSAADYNLSSRLTPGSTTVWSGEVFPLTYVLDVPRRNFSQLGSNIEWNSAPLIVEDWGAAEPAETTVASELRLNVLYRARAYAKTPGPLTLTAAQQLVNIQTGSVGFGLFQAPRVEQLSVRTNEPVLMVRPLPPAPPGFSGAVGQFKLVSKVIPEKAAVGEPVTWTLELSGTGNWPDLAGLPQRDVSRDFSVISPQAKRTPADGKLFDATLAEDVVLVPTRAGTYPLAPVSFIYFDPKSGSYQTITTPRTTVTITPPVAAPTAPATPASALQSAPLAPSPSAAIDAQLANLKTQVPTAPSGLPRDPLAGTAPAPRPLALRTVAALAAVPFAALGLFWLWLALRRARITDPLLPRRDARLRLAATLSRLRTSPANADLLLAWQHDARILWDIAHAAPSADRFKTSPALRPGRTASPSAQAAGETWSRLWSECDRSLYGPAISLPGDWPDRAEAALAEKRLPAFFPLRLFLPRNLFPFLFALAFAALNAPSLGAAVASGAADPAAAASAYRRGDFAAAERAWTAAVAAQPTDAHTRHNLSLALAQQDRWAEAAAHASSAFVLAPSAPAMRWQLALTCSKAGYIPAPLVGFLPAGPAHSLASLASPGLWQRLGLASALLAALSCGWLLWLGYQGTSARRRWLALALLAVAVLLAGSAALSLHTYGPLADTRTVIVWRTGTLRSIPTEADNTQKTTPLPAGSLALATKTLLSGKNHAGWTKLAFANGQTGWVRTEELIHLWQ